MTNVIKHKTKNNTNSILAIPIAVPATPVKPNTPATKANTKNMRDHLNIIYLHNVFSVLKYNTNFKKVK